MNNEQKNNPTTSSGEEIKLNTLNDSSETEVNEISVSESEKKSSFVKVPVPKILRNKKFLVIAVIVIGLVSGLVYFKDWFVVALVNGEPISRSAVISRLEKQSGKEVLDTIIIQRLIDQEARAQNLIVSSEDINAEIDRIKDLIAQGDISFEDALKEQGLTEQDLRDEIKTQKQIELLLGDKIVVSDQEVTDYLEANKDAISAADFESEEFKSEIKRQLKQQKISGEAAGYLTELQEKANITYFKNY